MNIQFRWNNGDDEFEKDSEKCKMLCIPARPRRGEREAELCVTSSDGKDMNYVVGTIDTGVTESSNNLCEEIARRWNDCQIWHSTGVDDDDTDVPDMDQKCLLRVEYTDDEGAKQYDYVAATWVGDGWSEDYLVRLRSYYESLVITHYMEIAPPSVKDMEG